MQKRGGTGFGAAPLPGLSHAPPACDLSRS